MKSLIKTAVTFSIVFLFVGSAIIPTIFGLNVKDNISQIKQESISIGLEEQEINETMNELLDLGIEERKKLGLSARKRVRENFELQKIVEQYEALYNSLAAAG